MIDTQLRYHLSVDPDALEDEEWADTYYCLLEILKAEKKQFEQ